MGQLSKSQTESESCGESGLISSGWRYESCRKSPVSGCGDNYIPMFDNCLNTLIKVFLGSADLVT